MGSEAPSTRARFLKRWGLILAILVVAAGVFLAMTLSSPVAEVRVLDESRNPVEGALVSVSSLGPKGNGANFPWEEAKHGPKPALKTDARGDVRIPYPRLVQDYLETERLEFHVDHPDFLEMTLIKVVDDSPAPGAGWLEQLKYWCNTFIGRPPRPPIVLRKGATLTVTGILKPSTERVKVLHVDLSVPTPKPEDWVEISPGVLMTRRAPVGTNALRLVHPASDGALFFSDVIAFIGEKGGRHRFELELKPARNLRGLLSEVVPRPVQNGKVILSVNGRAANDRRVNWRTSAPVKADGSFEFTNLPNGVLEVFAICDGYVSVTNNLRTPQIFMPDRGASVQVNMFPALTCEVLVTDLTGAPIEGARVRFSPNVLFGRSLFVFGDHGVNAEDMVRPGWKRDAQSASPYASPYSALTGKNGTVIISNLPPLAQSIAITHDNYVSTTPTRPNRPATRVVDFSKATSQMNQVTVMLQPK